VTILDQLRGVSPGRIAAAGLRALHPSLAALLCRDVLGMPLPRPRSSREHLDAAMRWLCRAQDRWPGGGVAAGYSLLDGWQQPYPETTGYIIPTFLDYARLTRQQEFRDRAIRMADWEIRVQLSSGAVQAGVYRGEGNHRRPAAFNTGQVILGWCRAFAETEDQRYLDAAGRAGDWLAAVQGAGGAWSLDDPETETAVHAYDVRTAWSLLELHRLRPYTRYAEAASRNLDWALAQQQDNGWFENNAFFLSRQWVLPLTHTIAYVMEGFQESWRLLGEDRYLHAVERTAGRLLRIFELRRFLAGEFDAAWRTTATYACLTGSAQVAGVWMRLYEHNGDLRYLNAALKLNDFVKATQRLRSLDPDIRGGVKGSQPIQGSYTRFTYVNWGAKFLADALMLEERLMAEVERKLR